MTDKCLLCGEMTRRRFSHAGFDVDWCDGCDFGRLAGDFTPEQIASFYGSNYYTHKPAPKDQKKTFRERLIANLAWRTDNGKSIDPSEVSGRTLCEIGCGGGSNLKMFRAAGYRTVGIEPDPVAAKRAETYGEIIVGTAEDTRLPDKFDVVLMCHALEHCVDPVSAVRNAASMLSPDGTLIIEVPNNGSLGFSWFKGKWPWSDIPRHLSFFTSRALQVLLEQAGMSITKTIHTGYTRQFSQEWREQVGPMGGWPLLLASSFQSPDRKYDSIRLHAKL